MAKIAKKKKVDNNMAYEFNIRKEDVVERVNFGSFEVIKTRKGIMYKSYTGYHVYTTPYAATPDGQVAKVSLYQWLENLIESKKQCEEHGGEKWNDDDGETVTYNDMLDIEKIMTEANITYPMVAFIDTAKASEFAVKHMEWLKKMTEELLYAETLAPASDDEVAKAEVLEAAKIEAGDTMAEIMEEMGDVKQE